jgi:hypothetical protein
MFQTIDEIREANEAAGFNWFAPETMEAFGSRVETGVIAGRYFVTSEQDRGFFAELYVGAMAIIGADDPIEGADLAMKGDPLRSLAARRGQQGLQDYRDASPKAYDGQRLYTVRRAKDNGGIDTVGENMGYEHLGSAITAAEEAAEAEETA